MGEDNFNSGAPPTTEPPAEGLVPGPKPPSSVAPMPPANLGGPTLGSAVGEIRPGGFWRRFCAFMIDLQVVSLVALPINLIFAVSTNITIYQSLGGQGLWQVILVQQLLQISTLFAIYLGYCMYFIPKRGATLGKLMMGLRLVHAETGAYLSAGRVFWREGPAKFFSSLTFMLGFLIAGFRADKRATHDFFANSRVLYQKADG